MEWAACTSWEDNLKRSPVIKDFPRPERSKRVAQIMSLGLGEETRERERPRAIKINNLRESFVCLCGCSGRIIHYEISPGIHTSRKNEVITFAAHPPAHNHIWASKSFLRRGHSLFHSRPSRPSWAQKKLSMEPPFGHRFCHYQHTQTARQKWKEKSLPYKTRISLNTRRQKGAVPCRQRRLLCLKMKYDCDTEE